MHLLSRGLPDGTCAPRGGPELSLVENGRIETDYDWLCGGIGSASVMAALRTERDENGNKDANNHHAGKESEKPLHTLMSNCPACS